jgi:hypothetical protein
VVDLLADSFRNFQRLVARRAFRSRVLKGDSTLLVLCLEFDGLFGSIAAIYRDLSVLPPVGHDFVLIRHAGRN